MYSEETILFKLISNDYWASLRKTRVEAQGKTIHYPDLIDYLIYILHLKNLKKWKNCNTMINIKSVSKFQQLY
jgi:hypothetical protein